MSCRLYTLCNCFMYFFLCLWFFYFIFGLGSPFILWIFIFGLPVFTDIPSYIKKRNVFFLKKEPTFPRFVNILLQK
ncbi:hypothetical protein EPR50_G00059270 [Perca flavescens]|uniref:Uncharacterized protein n=1 Tax=Perca flavescens TaxID=8167 RepID=A0A484D7T8_PERFV|nr:hypothetical protein EPR50_G00059270 [Perca flavescens]